MVFRLNDDDVLFPDPALADEDGLLAVGGDLTTGRLLAAYANGIFPWYNEGEPVCWYAPHERFVLYPEKINISKSLRKILLSGIFTITLNRAFDRVIEQCAVVSRKGEPGTWITTAMKDAYIQLHRAGHAHSVEAWKDGQLVGGLYGVQVNYVFCGESMFSTVTNASKAALAWLCNNPAVQLIDCQVYSGHLERMGAELMDAESFRGQLRRF